MGSGVFAEVEWMLSCQVGFGWLVFFCVLSFCCCKKVSATGSEEASEEASAESSTEVSAQVSAEIPAEVSAKPSKTQ